MATSHILLDHILSHYCGGCTIYMYFFSLAGHIVSSRKNETRDEKQQRKKAIKEERRVSLRVEFCLRESRNFKCQPLIP